MFDFVGLIGWLLGFVIGLAVPAFIIYILVKTIGSFISKLLGGFKNGKE